MPQRLIGLLVLTGGVILLVLGIRAADSFSSSLSRFFTGSPTDRAVWMSIAGVVCILAGATLTYGSARSKP